MLSVKNMTSFLDSPLCRALVSNCMYMYVEDCLLSNSNYRVSIVLKKYLVSVLPPLNSLHFSSSIYEILLGRFQF